METWPSEAIDISVDAEKSLLAATKSQYECFLQAMEYFIVCSVDLMGGYDAVRMSEENRTNIANFISGVGGAGLILASPLIMVELRRKPWGLIIACVAFLGPTVH